MLKSCRPDWFYRQTKIVDEIEENLEANEFEEMFYQNMVLNKKPNMKSRQGIVLLHVETRCSS